MQLVVTLLGSQSKQLISEVLLAASECKCTLIEASCAQLSQATAAYLLLEGNWNHIAKFEHALDAMEKNTRLRFHSLRCDTVVESVAGIPYSLEIIGQNQELIVPSVLDFLGMHHIAIQEFVASRYPAAYTQNLLFSAQLVVILPKEAPILSIREQFLDFCDQLNIDAILEPIKR